MLLKKAQTFNEQASADTFVPSVMTTYCHTKPLLAMPKGPEDITDSWDKQKRKNTRINQRQ